MLELNEGEMDYGSNGAAKGKGTKKTDGEEEQEEKEVVKEKVKYSRRNLLLINKSDLLTQKQRYVSIPHLPLISFEVFH